MTNTPKTSDPHAYAGAVGEMDLYLFNEGKHAKLHEKLGAHPIMRDGQAGVVFRVWAPNARKVSVVGSFNGWNPASNPAHAIQSSGLWECFVPALQRGEIYKYHIESHHNGYTVEKADPYGFHHETPPKTGSVVWDLNYTWNDETW